MVLFLKIMLKTDLKIILRSYKEVIYFYINDNTVKEITLKSLSSLYLYKITYIL